MNDLPVPEAELHAFVDGELSAERQAQIVAWLAQHPADAARVHAYRTQKEQLRRLYDPLLDESWPVSLNARVSQMQSPSASRSLFDADDKAVLSTSPENQRVVRTPLPRSLFHKGHWLAGGLLTLSGVLVGWLAHAYLQPPVTPIVSLPRQAAVAHAVYSPDIRRPVEISAENEEQLVNWLSKRLGARVRPARLGPLGYQLIGGRLLPGNSGPVAQFMYHDASGQRLTLYLSSENTANQETAFRFVAQGPLNVFYWVDGQFGYALSAAIDKDELARLAKAVHEQFEPR